MSLPLLILTSTTALVEEQVRECLDILLTTPVSSWSIVLTKWWSINRKLPLLSVLPSLIAAFCVRDSAEGIIAYLLLVVLLLLLATLATFDRSIGRTRG